MRNWPKSGAKWDKIQLASANTFVDKSTARGYIIEVTWPGPNRAKVPHGRRYPEIPCGHTAMWTNEGRYQMTRTMWPKHDPKWAKSEKGCKSVANWTPQKGTKSGESPTRREVPPKVSPHGPNQVTNWPNGAKMGNLWQKCTKSMWTHPKRAIWWTNQRHISAEQVATWHEIPTRREVLEKWYTNGPNQVPNGHFVDKSTASYWHVVDQISRKSHTKGGPK